MCSETELASKRDKTEFRRLRNYYRYNFKNGESDEAFVVWCETMCQAEEEGNHESQ